MERLGNILIIEDACAVRDSQDGTGNNPQRVPTPDQPNPKIRIISRNRPCPDQDRIMPGP